MEEEKELSEPLVIKDGEQNSFEVIQHTIKLIKYACKNNLTSIVPYVILFEDKPLRMISFSSLFIPYSKYISYLDKYLTILEELDEFELCREVLNLKESITNTKFTNNPNQNNLPKDLLNIISNL